MQFRQMVRGGAVIAALALSAATMPAYAQGTVRVVDAQGHQIGILVPVHNISTVPAMPDIAMFDALDRMMAREMAVMEATDRELMAQLNRPLRAVPAIDRDVPNQSMSWQSVEMVHVGGPTASCIQTVTVTSDGQSAPIVHTSSTGGQACAALTAPLAVKGFEQRGMDSPVLFHAGDRHMAAPEGEHGRNAL